MTETRDPLADRMHRGIGVKVERAAGFPVNSGFKLVWDFNGNTFGLTVPGTGPACLERGWKAVRQAIDGQFLFQGTSYAKSV